MMDKYQVWDAIATTMGKLMKPPTGDVTKPLFDLWNMAIAEGKELQRLEDKAEAANCDGRIVYGCPLFKKPIRGVIYSRDGKEET
jgi:hypothetical protein